MRCAKRCTTNNLTCIVVRWHSLASTKQFNIAAIKEWISSWKNREKMSETSSTKRSKNFNTYASCPHHRTVHVLHVHSQVDQSWNRAAHPHDLRRAQAVDWQINVVGWEYDGYQWDIPAMYPRNGASADASKMHTYNGTMTAVCNSSTIRILVFRCIRAWGHIHRDPFVLDDVPNSVAISSDRSESEQPQSRVPAVRRG